MVQQPLLIKTGLVACQHKKFDADVLVILTAVEKVAINFGKENEKWLDEITVADAKKYAAAGEFAEGSMKPKVEAAIAFAESKKGRVSIITLLEKSKDGIVRKNRYAYRIIIIYRFISMPSNVSLGRCPMIILGKGTVITARY